MLKGGDGRFFWQLTTNERWHVLNRVLLADGLDPLPPSFYPPKFLGDMLGWADAIAGGYQIRSRSSGDDYGVVTVWSQTQSEIKTSPYGLLGLNSSDYNHLYESVRVQIQRPRSPTDKKHVLAVSGSSQAMFRISAVSRLISYLAVAVPDYGSLIGSLARTLYTVEGGFMVALMDALDPVLQMISYSERVQSRLLAAFEPTEDYISWRMHYQNLLYTNRGMVVVRDTDRTAILSRFIEEVVDACIVYSYLTDAEVSVVQKVLGKDCPHYIATDLGRLFTPDPKDYIIPRAPRRQFDL